MRDFNNNKKIQDIVSTAKKLFWKHGIKRVSIEEICRVSKVSKVTFYKFFRNKEALAEYLLNDMLKGWHKQYREVMGQDIPFSAKIEQVIINKHSASEDVSEEFIKDIYNNEFTRLQKLITADRELYYAEIVKDMNEAMVRGEIRKNIKPELIIYLLEDITQKVLDENLSKLYGTKQELIMELTNYFFYGIMNGATE